MQWNLRKDAASRFEAAYGNSGRGCSVGAMFGSMIGSWICGALSGASLMYFFDPRRGARRRANLMSAGEGAFDAARDAAGRIGTRVSDAVSGARESASNAAGRLSDAASHAASRARKTTSRWFGRAGDAASDLSDRGSDLYSRGSHFFGRASDAASSRYRRGSKSLSRAYGRASDCASGLFDRDDDHDRHFARTAGIGVGAGLLCAAVGVGLMYFFDPRQGNRRRALLRDQFIHYGAQSRRAARSGRRYATHLGNRARGVAHDARQMLHTGGSAPVPDERLAARVRSTLGRCLSHAGAVRVAASNGTVVLSGPCPASEVDRLLADVRQVPGVASIENRLEVQGAAQPVVG